jgi:phospholipase C
MEIVSRHTRRVFGMTACLALAAPGCTDPLASAAVAIEDIDAATTTPIKHIVVVLQENRVSPGSSRGATRRR